MKAATAVGLDGKAIVTISIHAAREGGDEEGICPDCYRKIFQSTPPVKAATPFARSSPPPTAFQSTPPVKAATSELNEIMRPLKISIHAAREGGDYTPSLKTEPTIHFNPRRP